MAATSFLLSLLLSILPLAAAWSEVIPGPGLPSLEVLGVTSEQLYGMKFKRTVPFGLDKRGADFDSICLDQTRQGAGGGDIIACYNYLNMASTTCTVPGPNMYKQVFCTAGTATIVGQNVGSAPGGTSSRCDYVAFAVGWSFISCTKNVPAQNNNLFASGSCAAYGNGSLRVDTVLVSSE